MKKLLITWVICILALSLASCKDIQEDKLIPILDEFKLPDNVNYNGESVEINFYNRLQASSGISVFDLLVNDFKLLYPNIKVNNVHFNTTAELTSGVLNSSQSSRKPDIIETFPNDTLKYAKEDLIISLDSFINNQNLGYSQQELNDFIPGMLTDSKNYDLSNTTLSLPYLKTTEVLVYNKTYFTAHNLNVPKTWEELFDVASQIKALNPNSKVFQYDVDDYLFYNLSSIDSDPNLNYNANGQLSLNFNHDFTKENLKYLNEKYKEGLITTRYLNGNQTSASDGYNELNNGSIMMYATSSALLNYIYSDDYEFGCTNVPDFSGNGKNYVSGYNVALIKQDSLLKSIASWLFVKYLTSTSTQVDFAFKQMHYTPIRYSSFTSSSYLDWLDEASTIKSNSQLSKHLLVSSYMELIKSNKLKLYSYTPFVLTESKTFGSLIYNVVTFGNPSTIDEYIENILKEYSSVLI
jgi:multiple sugar transport system substrate-binding protein